MCSFVVILSGQRIHIIIYHVGNRKFTNDVGKLWYVQLYLIVYLTKKNWNAVASLLINYSLVRVRSELQFLVLKKKIYIQKEEKNADDI